MELPNVDLFEVDHQFQTGFEAGAVWAIMLVEPGEHEFTVHISNAEIFMALADLINFRLKSTEINDHFMKITFFRKNDERREDY